MVMSPIELKRGLVALGWTRAELGRRTSSHSNSVNRWVNSGPVPGPVAAFVVLALEVQRLHGQIARPSRR